MMKSLKLFFILFLCLTISSVVGQNLYTYVSDAGNFNNGPWQIVQFDQNGENPIVYIDDQLGWPQDIVFLETQDMVLISNLTTGRITKYNSTTGDYIEDFATVTGGPTRMKIGDDGLLYVIQWSGTVNKVLRYNLNGTFVDEFTNVGVGQSIGIAWDDSGNLYISSFAGGSVRKFDNSGDDMGLFINTNLSGPTNIEIKDGVMYVLDWNAGKCVRFDAATGDFIDDFVTTLTNPEGLTFLPNGNLLIGDNGTNSVRMFDSNGNDMGDYTTGGNMLTPNAVVLRDEIFLSVKDVKLNTIFVIPTIGNYFTINPMIASEYKTLDIYNVAGILVDTLVPGQSAIWNAQLQAEGLYFMVATTRSGKKVTQKIIVSNK
jgi:sugar lactone lactonase YvrE